MENVTMYHTVPLIFGGERYDVTVTHPYIPKKEAGQTGESLVGQILLNIFDTANILKPNYRESLNNKQKNTDDELCDYILIHLDTMFLIEVKTRSSDEILDNNERWINKTLGSDTQRKKIIAQLKNDSIISGVNLKTEEVEILDSNDYNLVYLYVLVGDNIHVPNKPESIKFKKNARHQLENLPVVVTSYLDFMLFKEFIIKSNCPPELILEYYRCRKYQVTQKLGGDLFNFASRYGNEKSHRFFTLETSELVYNKEKNKYISQAILKDLDFMADTDVSILSLRFNDYSSGFRSYLSAIEKSPILYVYAQEEVSSLTFLGTKKIDSMLEKIEQETKEKVKWENNFSYKKVFSIMLDVFEVALDAEEKYRFRGNSYYKICDTEGILLSYSQILPSQKYVERVIKQQNQ